ncbi:hypothetical protein ACN3E9_10975 [Vibrio pectenicida]|uniref:hypothetical protein n=1 Tax=Vibrio pectenicida TaxID=62763 RepID=UPI003B9C3398
MDNVFSTNIPNREIMGKAIEFNKSAHILYSRDHLSSPFITCASFSVELYIKSLRAKTYFDAKDKPEHHKNLYSKSDIKGHRLINLFARIPEVLKDELRQCYLDSDYPDDYKTLDLALDHIDSSFVDFRYSFETVNYPLNMTALLKISDIFHQYVYQLYEKNS